jgi:hypothetical protein
VYASSMIIKVAISTLAIVTIFQIDVLKNVSYAHQVFKNGKYWVKNVNCYVCGVTPQGVKYKYWDEMLIQAVWLSQHPQNWPMRLIYQYRKKNVVCIFKIDYYLMCKDSGKQCKYCLLVKCNELVAIMSNVIIVVLHQAD